MRIAHPAIQHVQYVLRIRGMQSASLWGAGMTTKATMKTSVYICIQPGRQTPRLYTDVYKCKQRQNAGSRLIHWPVCIHMFTNVNSSNAARMRVPGRHARQRDTAGSAWGLSLKPGARERQRGGIAGRGRPALGGKLQPAPLAPRGGWKDATCNMQHAQSDVAMRLTTCNIHTSIMRSVYHSSSSSWAGVFCSCSTRSTWGKEAGLKRISSRSRKSGFLCGRFLYSI